MEGSKWRVEGAAVENEKSAKRVGGGGGGDESGWTYYDNKWQDGRKVDGWGRYTRRRKWVRDAELVESTAASDGSKSNAPVELDATSACRIATQAKRLVRRRWRWSEWNNTPRREVPPTAAADVL